MGPLIDSVYELRDTHLEVRPDISFEHYEALGERLGVMVKTSNWFLGDWVLFGEARGEWADLRVQAMEATGLDLDTVQNFRWVAERFAPDRRRRNLSWSHHRVLARLEVDAQERWLDRAEQEGLSVHALQVLLRSEEPRPQAVPQELRPETLLDAAKAAYQALTSKGRRMFREWLAEQE